MKNIIFKSGHMLYMFLLFIVILKSIMGCTTDKSENKFDNNYSYTLVSSKKDKFIFLDSLSSSNDGIFSYYNNRKYGENIYILNKLTNSITLYSWLSGEFIKNIKLEKEGPNGVAKVTNFIVKSPDSIFVLATYSHKISLINSKGILIKKYSLFMGENQDKEALGIGVISYGDEANKMQYINNHLYVGASPFDDPASLTYYEKGRFGLDLNLTTGVKRNLMAAPKYWANKYKDGYRLTNQENMYGQDYNIDKGTCIVSFLTEDNLYEVDLNTLKIDTHNAKSKFLSKEIPWMDRKTTNIDKEFNFFIKNSFYPAVYYDPFRKNYLRFVAQYNEDKGDEFDGRPWVKYSIILFDANFKIIGETLLSEEYCSQSVIFTKEGIYLKKCNKNEDKIILTLFNIKKINTSKI